MRNEEEIRRVVENLAPEPDAPDPTGDNFKYGYFMGKLAALEWVLGDAPSSDMTSHFDFEDWMREQKEAGDAVREKLKDANKKRPD
jgi:hypothetical protein